MSIKTPNPTDRFVGQRVKLARNLASMSQETLGDALHLTFQQVQKYEKGSNRIAASRMQEIAAVFNRPVAWFFGEDENVVRSEAGDLVQEFLADRQGIALARAYLAITNPKMRLALLAIVEAAAAPATERSRKAA